MTLLARIFGASSSPIRTSADLANYLFGRRWQTDSGAVVTPDSALRVAAVYSCVRVVSEDMAGLPLITYRRTETGRDRAPDYWLSGLLDDPNPYQSGLEFREMLQAHVELCGNGYALKTVVRDEVRELLPVTPDRVEVYQISASDPRLVYKVTLADGTVVDVPQERMFHLRGLSLNGVTGIGTIAYQKETVGLAMQQLKHGAKLFANGAQAGGVLESEKPLSDQAYTRLKESFDEKYSGVDNAHKTILLEEGVKFSKVSFTSEEAQFLESRKYSRSEIAGIFRVPPHLIGDLERATFTNIEEQGRQYVSSGLLPRFRRWETAIRRQLIPVRDRKAFYVEHLADALLRGKTQERFIAYGQAIRDGWMNRNEVRERENLNPADGLDEFLKPLNMATQAESDAALAAQQEKDAAAADAAQQDRAAAANANAELTRSILALAERPQPPVNVEVRAGDTRLVIEPGAIDARTTATTTVEAPAPRPVAKVSTVTKTAGGDTIIRTEDAA
ncbi:MAG: phage portal protein [Gemmatimonadaceae bacterium]|nr:phage portal protein [Gemmatimonadaceae bacterium]